MSTAELIHSLGAKLLRILLILGGATFATFVIKRIAQRVERYILHVAAGHAGGAKTENEKRVATVSGIIRKTAVVCLWAFSTVMVLAEAGFDIMPLLAGAGIAGLAVGFGAQNLVRDMISGMFLLIEDQIRIGDVATVNNQTGSVEEINLRTTVLRSGDGAVHVFPNGAITTLANLTREFSYYMFDIGVAYKEDTDQVLETLRAAAEQFQKEEPYRGWVLAPMEILGVDRFGEAGVHVRTRIKTLPGQQWTVGRELNRRFKKAFADAGIEFSLGRPVQVTLDWGDREELKRTIREVLREEPHRRG